MYFLNSLNCTDVSQTCKGVFQTASYVPPNCADSANASALFTTLKTNLNEESTLVVNMVNDLEGQASGTPNTIFKSVNTSMKGVIPVYQNIESRVTKTIQFAKTFSLGFSEFTDCRIIRKEILDLEYAMCFGFNYHLYIYFCMLSLSTVFLLVVGCSVCCAFRNVEDIEQYGNGYRPKEEGDEKAKGGMHFNKDNKV